MIVSQNIKPADTQWPGHERDRKLVHLGLRILRYLAEVNTRIQELVSYRHLNRITIVLTQMGMGMPNVSSVFGMMCDCYINRCRYPGNCFTQRI